MAVDDQARLLLGLLRHCSTLSRPEATQELTPVLHDIEEYLRHHALPAIKDRTASENASNYPHLGELLTLCARHPVILANRSRVDLVLSAVIAYANQQDHYQDGYPLPLPPAENGGTGDGNILSSTPIRMTNSTSSSYLLAPKFKSPMPPEAMWCAHRVKDVMQIKHSRHSAAPPMLTLNPTLEQHLKLCYVDRRTYEENAAVEIISTLTTALAAIEDDLEQCDLEAMASWTMDLSSLCVPIASDERMADLSLRLMFVAQKIQSQHQTRSLMNRIMEQVYATPQATTAPLDVGHQSIAQIAQHMQSSTWLATIVACPDRMITAVHGTTSHADPTPSRQQECVFGLFLQSLAKTAGEMPDWRIVRICVLMLRFCLGGFLATRQPPRPSAASGNSSAIMEMDNDDDRNDNNATVSVMVTSPMQSFLDAVRSLWDLALTLSSADTRSFPRDMTVMDKMLSSQQELSRAAQAYIYSGGGPSTVADRQHAVFLMMTTLAQQDYHLLVELVDYLESADNYVAQQKSIARWMHWLIFSTPVPEEENEETLGSRTTTMRIGELPGCDGKDSIASSGDLLDLLLQTTRASVRSGWQNNDKSLQNLATNDETLTELETILKHYQQVLALNPVVLADFIFAICMTTKDCVSVQKLLRLAPVGSDSPTFTRWLDILSTQGTSQDLDEQSTRRLISQQQADRVTHALLQHSYNN
ncbi:hypothetical protein BGZ73_006011 [Actinomortierella ambigua]|nr:hypothetical protein BGZ73_006011 [Actinomortierella ambigua]